MWITEIHHKTTGALIGRYEHGPSWFKASNAHGSLMFSYAEHRVHLVWHEPAQ
jgi:hypothetical protein